MYLLNDCCWLCNWCRSVVFRCESAFTGGEAIDEGMGRVASEAGSSALKKGLNCEGVGGAALACWG